MKLALITVPGSASEALDAWLAFHRSAGVGVVVVGDAEDPATRSTLDAHARDGFVVQVGATSKSELARIAVDELGADWIIPSSTDQLWWPRGESLNDVLDVIPPRYGVVQALVRTFFAGEETESGALGESTLRTSLLGPDGSGGAPLRELLRPVYRAGPNMTLDEADWTLGGRRVPLRAWYPIEVLHYPASRRRVRSCADRVADLRTARSSSTHACAMRCDARALDVRRAEHRRRRSYAVECAAVGEVDLVRLDRQISDLELRIAELEARFWPRVRRMLSRLARRRS